MRDYWTQDDFEDTVAAALIACFEAKVKKNRGAPPADRLTEERVAVLRAEGPYIASNSRLMEAPEDGGNWHFDMVNDRLPMKGLHAFRPGGLVAQAANDSDTHVAVVELQLSATENSSLHLGAADGPVLSLLPLPYALREDI